MDSELKIFRKRQPDYSVEKRVIASIVCNRFFTVHFYTNKGELRKLNGRLGVTKYIKRWDKTVSKYHDDTVEMPHKYLVVYDVKAKGYRNVNIETIQCINVDNVYHMNI